MNKVKENSKVRIYDYDKNDVNAYARIHKIYPDGRVWLTNLNAPLCGTISDIFTKDEFERMTKLKLTL